MPFIYTYRVTSRTGVLCISPVSAVLNDLQPPQVRRIDNTAIALPMRWHEANDNMHSSVGKARGGPCFIGHGLQLFQNLDIHL